MQAIEPGSVVHTDGWLGYEPVERNGYRHQITFLRGQKESPSELLPRVHRVVSLLKRWLLGTHQGAVSLEHLDYYLDEFTFRFNRRKSRSRGKLFFRLAQQAVAVEPVTYKSLVKCCAKAPEPTTTYRGYLSEVDTPFGDIYHRIPQADPDEYVPIHRIMQDFIDIADLVKNIPREIHGLLQYVIGEVY